MFVPAEQLIASLNLEFRKLAPRLGDFATDGSGTQAVAHGLHLLEARQAHGKEWLRAALDGYIAALEASEAMLDGISNGAIGKLLQTVRDSRQQLAGRPIDVQWTEIAGLGEKLIVALNDCELTADQRRQLCSLIVDWEEKALLSELDTGDAHSDKPDHEITKTRLEAYLGDRFNDPTLKVGTFQPLAGGFGKETIIFSVEQGPISGEFVMRRDLGRGVSLSNDCHVIDREYPIIRSLRGHGFPAPEALWLDTEHTMLPGGDFIVMRRAPGTLGGSFFGAQTEIPASLAATLAQIAARLHALPPLTELGDAASFIRTDLWDLSRGEAARRYIRGWYDYWLAEAHSPSPSLAAIYGWLFDNAPARSGRASLLHGDIGFHNFLFDKGALSAVLDWEFAHIGDPAEEIGYIKLTVGGAFDWDSFMQSYVEAGGDEIDRQTLHYFQVWGYARNASAANIAVTRFNHGVVNDLKLSVLPHYHYTRFIRGAEALIAAGPA